jgi:catalase
LIRFSNGAFKPGPDTGFDGRGMAIKIISEDPSEASSQGHSATHDILMINYPVFFSPDVRDYRDFAKFGALTGDQTALKRYFFPGFNPFGWRIRQGYLAYQIASQKISSPLVAQYYSMTPYQFGTGRAVKYSARPCAGSSVEPTPKSDEPNFLRDALRTGLSTGSACFELLVQESKPGMEIEDATAEWSQSLSPFQPVGKIEVPTQQIDSDHRDARCENLIFTPWNAPAEQRPLGGINRLRKDVYERISKYRTEHNGVVPEEAGVVWDEF